MPCQCSVTPSGTDSLTRATSTSWPCTARISGPGERAVDACSRRPARRAEAEALPGGHVRVTWTSAFGPVGSATRSARRRPVQQSSCVVVAWLGTAAVVGVAHVHHRVAVAAAGCRTRTTPSGREDRHGRHEGDQQAPALLAQARRPPRSDPARSPTDALRPAMAANSAQRWRRRSARAGRSRRHVVRRRSRGRPGRRRGASRIKAGTAHATRASWRRTRRSAGAAPGSGMIIMPFDAVQHEAPDVPGSRRRRCRGPALLSTPPSSSTHLPSTSDGVSDRHRLDARPRWRQEGETR